jgi:ADP-ribose pyrophosphatase YjhB (NUDIX family)
MNTFDYTAGLPMKRMAAGALFFNANRQILIVQPTYRESWLVPGGIVEAHESPHGE